MIHFQCFLKALQVKHENNSQVFLKSTRLEFSIPKFLLCNKKPYFKYLATLLKRNFLCPQSMIQLKERKEMDEAFKKAQKPWAKLLQKVERTRLEYHTACKQERTAQNQERNASGDSSLSPDQVST